MEELRKIYLDEVDSQFLRLAALRESLENSLRFADQKAYELVNMALNNEIFPYRKEHNKFINLYLAVINSDLAIKNMLEECSVSTTISNVDIAKQCNMLQEALIKKYDFIRQMVDMVRKKVL